MMETITGASFANPWVIQLGVGFTGQRKGVSVREGFGMVITDAIYESDVEYSHFGGDHLKFQFKLAGCSEVSGERGEFVPISAGQISFLVQPTDSWKRERIAANLNSRSVTLICSRKAVSDLLSCDASIGIPPSINDFLHERVSVFSFGSLPLPPSIRIIVDDILRCPFTGAVGDLMLEAKALELLCMTIQQVLKDPTGRPSMRARDLAKVRELCAFLDEHPLSTLGISELCKLVAWNETQMMECFKQVTGTTISKYRHHLRMENAKRQLLETEASITEIAFDAGYEHPSNFATAFKRTFGFPPKMVRSRIN